MVPMIADAHEVLDKADELLALLRAFALAYDPGSLDRPVSKSRRRGRGRTAGGMEAVIMLQAAIGTAWAVEQLVGSFETCLCSTPTA